MEIWYAPFYKGPTHMALTESDAARFDVLVVNNDGLIAELQLRFGIYHKTLSPAERLTRYYRGLRSWLKANPNNELYKPFKAAGLDVARKCLEWRDELRLYGWTAETTANSDRLKALQGVEQDINLLCMADYVAELTEAITASTTDSCKDFSVKLPCDAEKLQPAFFGLLNAMAAHGANIVNNSITAADGQSNLSRLTNMLLSDSSEKVTFSEGDDSVLLYNFANETEAAQFMAATSHNDRNTTWINANNKTTDNFLRLMGKPALGSTTSNSVPQAAQLLLQGIGLFERPLNIRHLIDWLQTDLHPLNGWFRRTLSETIVGEGGYNNKKCDEVIKKFIDGDFQKFNKELSPEEIAELKAKDRKKRESDLALFLPIDSDADTSFSAIQKFVSSLQTWAKSRGAMYADTDFLRSKQLYAMADMAGALLLLMEDADETETNLKQISNWTSSLFFGEEYTQYVAECGCTETLQTPGAIASGNSSVVWWNMQTDESSKLCCDFLMPSEREVLGKELTFWQQENEIFVNNISTIAPVCRCARNLILAQCDTVGGEPVQKHPLMVRIENLITNWSTFTRRPNLHHLEWEKVEQTCNEMGADTINFCEKNLVKWPNHLSPTAMNTLIQYPLDYLLERIVRLQETGPGALDELKTTKGTVAHAVIEQLFKPRTEGEKPSAEIISQRINQEYDSVFSQMIEAHGAILNLPENRLETNLLNEQLRAALSNLLAIVQSNKLKVTACERFVKGFFGILPPDKDGNDVIGYVDMTLEDENRNPVVFDFKWTSSKSYYKDLLTKNESIQLQLYRRMMEMANEGTTARVGYFLMPEARLYSTEHFVGDFCTQLEVDDNSDLLQKVKNSIAYRIRQIENGTVENGDGLNVSDLTYGRDTDDLELVHLKSYDGKTHDGNPFSNYTLFKR